ncbi:gluconokinase [Aestuariivirga litoralis]|uniref:gluconokinase n=1 Tax=Aestuariivirga litoralis TaxID=2650924 RepID=UPI001FEDB2AC|nr:gluconokinase [Aestuariivirga litoralis]
MGVTSCGKTTVGEGLAQKLGIKAFVEGDRLHPEANIAKMSAGIALTDEDRWPWLKRIGAELAGTEGAIASCSALKRSYRECIVRAAGRPVAFVFLDGARGLLQERIDARKGHFMPPSLLDSQLRTLEPPVADEDALRLDVADDVPHLISQAATWLEEKSHG